MKLSLVLTAFLVVLYCSRDVIGQECSGAMTCGQCYAIPNCAWCAEPSYVGMRCFSSDNIVARNMCPNMLEDADSSTTLDTLPLSSDNQVSLRKATLRLRAGATETVTVSIRAAENFPLDLYMLTDFSNSLEDDLETLRRISRDIADAIQNISTRFQVGFGTFVDKLVLPFVSTAQIHGTCDGCPAFSPFSYIHHINLTNDSALFANGFQNIDISTNVDDPEGTFDAILQAALCDQIVGWRENARKILLVITDDVVHTAGDGKLAGIVRPVPNICQTRYDPATGQFTYVNNMEYDYPSLEQLRQVFTNNTIVPVFAVTSAVSGLYNSIANALQGSNAVTASLSDDSSNIISVIETAYESIISNVSLTFPDTPGVGITYSADCPEMSLANPNGLSCSNVSVNDTTTFTINVTLNECSDNFEQVVTMSVPAYGSFQIRVIGICECDCESSAVRNSPNCNNNGTLSCGVCECNPGWTGDTCNCDRVDDLTCPGSTGDTVCNDRGQCECGQCLCSTPSSIRSYNDSNNMLRYNVTDSNLLGSDSTVILTEYPRVYGDACECDNFRCRTNSQTGLVCSGTTNGICTCNNGNLACECNTLPYGNLSFTGEACECNNVYCYNTSIPFEQNQRCNNAGTCDACNVDQPCTCFPGFVGRYCVPAESFLSQCNSAIETCIRCIADNVNYVAECPCQNALSYNYSRLPGGVNDDYMIDFSSTGSTRRCTFLIRDPICTYVYYIGEPHPDAPSNAGRPVHVQPRSGCSPLRWWHIALILLAVLIIIGITILVIIKLIFLCLDYAELKNFQKEVAEADLSKNFNPLYQSPEVKYDNVAFGKE